MARPNKLRRRKDGRHTTSIDGKDYYFSKIKAEATRQYHALMAELKPEHSALAGRPATLNGLIIQWLRIHDSKDNEYRAAPLAEHLGTTRLNRIDVSFLTRYLNKLKKENFAARSIRDRMGVARRILTWGHRNGWIRQVPDQPKLPRAMRLERDIPADTLAEKLDSLPEPARSLAWFILLTGARPAEARLLEWKQVDLKTTRCVLASHKTAKATGTPRTLYLSKEAILLLERRRTQCAGGRFVFPNRTDQPYTAGGFRSITSRRGITPYALRHTFAQIASESLMPQDLAILLGHRNVQTSQHYYSVKDQRASRLIDAVAVPGPSPAPAARDHPAGPPAAASDE